MKPFVLFLTVAYILSGCYSRVVQGSDAPLAAYVGRLAEVRKNVIIFDRGIFGRLGVPAGEWPISKDEIVKTSLEPGASFKVTGVVSRRIDSGKHYYFACRYDRPGEEVTFDYPADAKYIDGDHLTWR